MGGDADRFNGGCWTVTLRARPSSPQPRAATGRAREMGNADAEADWKIPRQLPVPKQPAKPPQELRSRQRDENEDWMAPKPKRKPLPRPKRAAKAEEEFQSRERMEIQDPSADTAHLDAEAALEVSAYARDPSPVPTQASTIEQELHNNEELDFMEVNVNNEELDIMGTSCTEVEAFEEIHSDRATWGTSCTEVETSEAMAERIFRDFEEMLQNHDEETSGFSLVYAVRGFVAKVNEELGDDAEGKQYVARKLSSHNWCWENQQLIRWHPNANKLGVTRQDVNKPRPKGVAKHVAALRRDRAGLAAQWAQLEARERALEAREKALQWREEPAAKRPRLGDYQYGWR
eukprot:gnl/TRDRNA2_/TRDRNA2_92403_c0_seq2.p1 gnl/TRDRNA2_/TRDRNA2_92403_c0~~gnl/TRDRNA2_/TRDRNA2_92403_c0_seq2.p1  ORF type:complete len:346 (-),score=58.62 gnl/TRDRNA2_/TRDRNA2_92403_c0_seq2:68-1105(-)